MNVNRADRMCHFLRLSRAKGFRDGIVWGFGLGIIAGSLLVFFVPRVL